MDPQPPEEPRVELLAEVRPSLGTRIAAMVRRFGLEAFTTSLLIHVVFFAIAFLFLYKWVYPPEETVDFLPGGGGGGQGASETHKVQTTVRKRMASTSVPSTRITSTSSTAAFALPDVSPEMLDSGVPMDLGGGSGGGVGGGFGGGKGPGFGQGIGKGFGDGQLGIGALIPTIMKGRCSDSERLRMVHEAGGTVEVEQAVKKSLAWFKTQQNPDGSWGTSYKPAMTGLVLLCYLGHCESTQSGEYGQNVLNGIVYLIDHAAKNKGNLMTTTAGNSGVYEHAIATYGLAEALCYTRTLKFPLPKLEETVQKAATIIIKGQTTEGGWDYGYANKKRNDLSVAGWQIQALKAAKVSGVKLENLDLCLRKATEYISKIAYVDNGKFAYTGKGAHPAMTPIAALCLQQLGQSNIKPAQEAIDLMLDGLKLRDGDKTKDKNDTKAKKGDFAPLFAMRYTSEHADLYAWYYMVQAMRTAGGEEWERTNKAILEEIVTAQNPDGSFKAEVGRSELSKTNTASNPTFRQALNTLILEAYYRFLPGTSAGRNPRSRLENIPGMR